MNFEYILRVNMHTHLPLQGSTCLIKWCCTAELPLIYSSNNVLVDSKELRQLVWLCHEI